MNAISLIPTEGRIGRLIRYALALAFLCLGVFTLYVGARAYVSVKYYEAALAAVESDRLDDAVKALEQAVAQTRYPLYYRTLSQIKQAQAEALLMQSDVPLRTEDSDMFGTLADAAVGHARSATALDAHNYLNWIVLGNAYSQLVRVNVAGMRGYALDAYTTAQTLSPESPIPLFLKARIVENYTDALRFLEEALRRHPNYIPAQELQHTLLKERRQASSSNAP